jgi:hypothetical protein
LVKNLPRLGLSTEKAEGDGALLASGELSASALGGSSSFERLGDRREFSANIFEELPPLCGFHFRFIAQGYEKGAHPMKATSLLVISLLRCLYLVPSATPQALKALLLFGGQRCFLHQ